MFQWNHTFDHFLQDQLIFWPHPYIRNTFFFKKRPELKPKIEDQPTFSSQRGRHAVRARERVLESVPAMYGNHSLYRISE